MRWLPLLFSLCFAAPALAEETTTTSTAGMSAEDLELARYLDLLENWELLEDWELLELYPVLAEGEDE